MKKSKFLKKSLATLLALMLVVAMIPVGAAAVTVGDGTIVSLEADAGEVTGSGKAYTDTLPYTAEPDGDGYSDVIVVALDARSGYDAVVSTVDGEEFVLAEDGPSGSDLYGIYVAADTTVTFYAVKADTFNGADLEGATKSAAYTVKVVSTPASNDTSVKEAKIGEIEGVVDNTAKTITFVLPWSATSEQTANVVMNAVVLNPETGEEIPVTVNNITVGEDKTFSAVAQSGASQVYTIITSYTEGLKTLSIGGVAAVLGTDEDDPDTYEKYVVTLPAGTDLDEELPLVFTTGTAISKAVLGDLGEVKSSDSYTFTKDKEYKMALTNKAGVDQPDSEQAEIVVKVADSSDTKITAAEGAADGYTETGVIDGKNISIVMPKGTDLKDVDVTLTAAADSTITVVGIDGGSFEPQADPTKYIGDENCDFSKPLQLKVTAADETTVDYYTLNVTVAGVVNQDPAITSAKVTFDDDQESTASIKDKTITFTVPYSTPADISAANPEFTCAKTPATKVESTIAWDSLFEGTHSVTATSDAGDKVTYTVVFKKAKAETGKTLSSLSVTTAETVKDVTAENTYKATISGTKITGTLPYAVYSNDDQELVAQFELPKGAKFYNTDEAGDAGNIFNELESGFNEETETPKDNAIIVVGALKDDADEKNPYYYVVADETAAVLIDEALKKGDVGVDDLKAAPYKGHVTLYTLTVKSEEASKEALLKTFTDEKKNITSSVSATALKLTVPASYDDGNAFKVIYTASTGATVKALYTDGEVELTEDTEFKIIDGALNVVSEGNKPVTKIKVESEARVDSAPYATTQYTVSVTVSDPETGALITALKANKTAATISGKNINVTMPFGTDLSKVTMDYTASKMATVEIDPEATEEDEVEYYDLTDGAKITVTSEDEDTVNVYTLTAKVADQFSDVKEGAWYYDYVTEAAAAGIINGKGNGIFDPEGNITRGDFALMTVRMLGVDVSGYTTAPFSDVKASDYYMKAIAYCAEKGIIGGTGDGKFEPEKNILREEAAKIIAIALNLDGTTTEKFKDDAKISNWAKGYVYACKEAGIFGGDNGNFLPGNPITRAETAKVMVISMNK